MTSAKTFVVLFSVVVGGCASVEGSAADASRPDAAGPRSDAEVSGGDAGTPPRRDGGVFVNDASVEDDEDGDYLSTTDEAAEGTSPTNPDTDGDGYLDGDEVLMGTDPLDSESRIYQGGWPFQRLKDSIPVDHEDFAWELRPVEGERLPRVTRVDRYGEEVDLYDYALHGKPILLVMTGGSCGNCRALAQMLKGGNSRIFDSPEYLNLRRLFQSGEILYVNVLLSPDIGRERTLEYLQEYDDDWGQPGVAMLNDMDPSVRTFTAYTFEWNTPAMVLLHEDMTVAISGASRDEVVAKLYELLPPP